MDSGDTIVALGTAPGVGALAMIRVSGVDAFAIVKRCVRDGERFAAAKCWRVALYELEDRGDLLDEVTIMKYKGPRSFTGEDMVEICCHGGAAVYEGILECLVDRGARYARGGEFTRRALCNGKVTLPCAEAIKELVCAQSDAVRRRAMGVYSGNYRRVMGRWREVLEGVLAEVEVRIEFGEDGDISSDPNLEGVRARICAVQEEVAVELERRRAAEVVEGGVKVVLAGPRNAGKSTLLNLILGYERAIVDRVGGTTRDFVTESVKIGGVEYRLYDTAGIGVAASGVEACGIARSEEIIRESDLLVWVTAADEEIGEFEERAVCGAEERQWVCGIINKVDLGSGAGKEQFFKERGVRYIRTVGTVVAQRETVCRFLSDACRDVAGAALEQGVVVSRRQEEAVRAMARDLEEIRNLRAGQEELVGEWCKEALGKLEEYEGRVASEDVLNRVFEEFCVGK